MKTENIVHIDKVSKKFGTTTAIEQLSLHIKHGEFVTFLGPSGCGKSTTLRILGGFEIPDTGKIILEGKDVTKYPPEKRQVNMVFQDYALFPHMTVSENISFALVLKGLNKNTIIKRQNEIMNFLQIQEYGNRDPNQLSGGQRQRVALARALAPNPALLLLDEPLGALDAKLRTQVQRELKSIQRKTNKTFLFVTHDQEEALTMSDRIIVMHKGRVEQDGSPEDLYYRPSNRFVAEFIGETNFLSGKVISLNNSIVGFEWYGYKIFGVSNWGIPKKGSNITAALRLENLILSKVSPKTTNKVQGRILNKTFQGSRLLIEVLIENTDEILLRVFVDNKTAQEIGSGIIWLGWDTESMAILND